MVGGRLLAVAMLGLMLVAGMPGAGAGGGSPYVSTVSGLLPASAQLAASATDGQAIYIFGGFTSTESGGSDSIVRFNPATGESAVLSAKLPHTVYGALAAWTGQKFVILGGNSNALGDERFAAQKDIVLFDPLTQAVSKAAVQLPWAVHSGAAAWDGAAVDVFGGCVDDQQCRVLRYDPLKDEVTQVGPNLVPAGGPVFQNGVAVTVGATIFLFGAQDHAGTASPHDRVLRYDVASQALSLVPARMPAGRTGFAAAGLGQSVLIMGGGNITEEGGLFTRSIFAFDDGTEVTTELCSELNAVTDSASAVSIGNTTYLLGADTTDFRHVERLLAGIVTFPCPQAPLSPPGLPPMVVVGLFPMTPPPVVVIQRDIPALATVKSDVAPAVDISFTCGAKACHVDSNVQWGLDPPALPTLPPIPADPGALVYVGIEVGPDQALPDGRIRIELNATPVQPIGAGTPADLSVHYFAGDHWVDLGALGPDGGMVKGAASHDDLEVFATGYDAQTGTAFAVVNHTSVYALAPATHAGTTSNGLPLWAVIALALEGIGIVVVGCAIVVTLRRR